MFENAKVADLVTVKGGEHFLSASHPKEVDDALVSFVSKWAKA
jgi:pimeloyl-ACP methyl ester carboxylesterase